MENKKSNTKEIEIEIKSKQWQEALDTAFNKIIKTTKIDGFRPGKAPRDIYEKKYGVQPLIAEAIDSNMQKAYEKALKKYEETPIVTPTVSIKKADTESVIYVFSFVGKPEVNIKKYTNLGVKKETIKITKKDVEEEIEKLRKEYADLMVKEGKAELGDTVIIDFEGFLNGKAFEGGKSENYSLELGSNSFIPGFEDGVVGMKKDEEKDINLKFPKDYHAKDLAGKDVVFKVKLHEVKTKVYPELNEDFFLDLGLDDVKTKEDLEKTIKETMQSQKEYETENKYMDDLFDAVLKQTTVEVPHQLIHEEIDRMVEEYEERLKMQGITLDQFLKYTNSSLEDLKNQMHLEAEKRIKLRFIIDEIIAKEKLTVTDEEVDNDVLEKSNKNNMTKEEFIKAFGGIEMVKYDLLVQKVIEILKK